MMISMMNSNERCRPAFGREAGRKNILLVDSSEPYRDILGSLLEEEGHHVTSSGELEEAIRLLQNEQFDFVITDYSPSGVNGLRLLAFAKQCQDKLPVLVISSEYECEPYLAAMNMGALDYLCKPLDYLELQRLINLPRRP